MPNHRVRFLLMVVIVAVCCVRTAKQIDSPPHAQLIGTWQWLISSGGLPGHTITPEKAGYTETMVLAETDAYRLYRDDSLIMSGAYSYVRDKGLLILRTHGRWEYHITLVGDTLRMRIINALDGYDHTYIRSK